MLRFSFIAILYFHLDSFNIGLWNCFNLVFLEQFDCSNDSPFHFLLKVYITASVSINAVYFLDFKVEPYNLTHASGFVFLSLSFQCIFSPYSTSFTQNRLLVQ